MSAENFARRDPQEGFEAAWELGDDLQLANYLAEQDEIFEANEFLEEPTELE